MTLTNHQIAYIINVKPIITFNMKKIIFILIAVLGMSTTSFAQSDKEIKKAIKTAQRLVKDARDEMEREDVTDKRHAKQLIDQAMKDKNIQDWDQTWYEAAEIYGYFYKQLNISSYQNAPYDTVGMYNYLTQWFDFAMKADSIQQIPNSKGKVSNEVRDKMKPSMIAYMNSFINGGIFYFNHRSDYNLAYKMFDKYFTLAESSLFKADMDADEVYQENKANFSYFPALAAYNLEKWNDALKYALIAQDDEEYGETATEFICESYGNLGDSVKWLEATKAGLQKYPTVDYYYNKLLNYYSTKNNMAELEEFVNQMVALDPEKAYNYYVLGYVAQISKNYDKAIENYQKAIDKDATLADAYNNLGLCILKQASDYDDANAKVDYRSAEGKKVQAKIKEYYQQALPYYIKLKEVAPESIDKWGMGLYNIYYYLKMDKEFKDIEKQLEQKGLI